MATECLTAAGLSDADLKRILKSDDLDLIKAVADGVVDESVVEATTTALRRQVINGMRNRLYLDHLLEELKGVRGKGIGAMQSWAIGIVAHDLRQSGNKSVQQVANGLRNAYYAKLNEAIDYFKPRAFRTSASPARLKELRKALHGEDAPPEATRLAKLFLEVMNEARKNFNRAGGGVRYLDSFGLPHHWDAGRFGTHRGGIGREEFIRDMKGLVDRDRMVIHETNTPMNDRQLEIFLSHTYTNIATRGMAQLEAGLPELPGVIANRYSQARMLHFKNSDAWDAAMTKYGAGNLHDAVLRSITNYLDDMAQDTAFMQVLGPNSARVYKTIVDTVAKESGDSATRFSNAAKNMYNHFARTTRTVDPNLAQAGQIVRNWQVMTHLAFAPVTALNDLSMTMTAVRYNGGSFARTLGRMGSTLFSKRTRQELAQMGFVADYLAANISTNTRFGELLGSGFTAKGAGKTMRWSGMNHWTQSLKMAMSWEMHGVIGRQADKSFADLPSKTRRFLRNYALDEADWEKIRGATDTERGFVDASKLDQTTAARYLGAVDTELRYGVFEAGARERAVMFGGAERGTVLGEAAMTGTQFLSFPIGSMMLQISRHFRTHEGKHLGEFALMFLTMTTLGYLSGQITNVLKGRDVEDPRDPKVLLAAVIKGGGLFMLNSLFSAVSAPDFGKKSMEAVAGPGFADIFGILDWLGYVISRDTPEEVWDAIKVAASRNVVKEVPLPIHTWYTWLLLNEGLSDMIEEWIDPDAAARSAKAQQAWLAREGKTRWIDR